MTTTVHEIRGFHETLAANGRSPEIPEADDAYGWLVGSWDLEVLHYYTDVSARGLQGEAHFDWVLEGRAIQDTWIMPRREERKAEIDRTCNMYGSTLRVWDPEIRLWRITWMNPVANVRCEMVGRWSSREVVQIGTSRDGTVMRWRFTEITSHSFHWIGESLQSDGVTWKMQGEFLAKKR